MGPIEASILTHMLNNAGLKALIGTRLYPNELPQNPTLPAVTYNLISKPRQELGNQFVRIQYDCYAGVYGQVKQVTAAIESAANAATSVSNLHTVYIDNAFDGFDTQTGRHRGVVDVVFYYLKEANFEK